MTKIRKIIENYSAKIAKNKLLVQGTGGNISWKTKDKLWIKASGKSLKDALNKNIFVSLNRCKLDSELSTLNLKSNLIPSIETKMHAIMKQKIVVHLHSIEIISMLIKKDCNKILKNFLKKNINVCLLNYFKPGNNIALEMSKNLKKNSSLNIFLLKNHGIVIGGNSIEEIHRNIRWLIKQIGVKYCQKNKIKRFSPKKIKKEQLCFKPIKNKKIQALVHKNSLFTKIKKLWAICPDHIVFLGKYPILFNSKSHFLKTTFNASDRNIIFIRNCGVYVRSDFNNTIIIEQLEAFYEILVRIKKSTQVSCLAKKEVDNLYLWDREKYRILTAT